jgi:hypothetical protein
MGRAAGMCDEIEQHIAAVEAFYGPLITDSDSRLEGGTKLWAQFTDAVAAYRKHGKAAFTAVIERVNELAVARIILNDPSLPSCKVFYEPQIAADDRRIDFVVPAAEGGSLYIEVKTVRPTAGDSEENWQKYEARKERHTENVSYLVDKNWLGAAIYGNSFSARSKFMQYTRDFEARLAEAHKVQPGRGFLVFCGSGMEWHRSELEDFADFYLTGRHRQDDPFAKMEAEALTKGSIELKRNIAAFGFVKRPMDCITEEKWIADVRGPLLFR